MKVFVSGSFTDKERVRQVQASLRMAGHVITWDWTGNSTDGIPDPKAYERASSMEDIDGVARCDFVVLISNEKVRGSLVELGAALALKKPVIVLQGASELPFNVFLRHPLVRNKVRTNSGEEGISIKAEMLSSDVVEWIVTEARDILDDYQDEMADLPTAVNNWNGAL